MALPRVLIKVHTFFEAPIPGILDQNDRERESSYLDFKTSLVAKVVSEFRSFL